MGFTIDQVRDDLRLYLRDSSSLNLIIQDGTENSDSDLTLAINFGLMNFNFTAPVSSFSLSTLPADAYYFIINEAVIQVLISSGIFNTRNRLNYSNGGLTVADHDKGGPYQSWIQILSQLKAQESMWKKTRDINSMYGGVSSEFLSYTNSDLIIF